MGAIIRTGFISPMDPAYISEGSVGVSLSKKERKDVLEVRIVPLLLVLNGYMFTRNKFGKVIIHGPGIPPVEVGFGIYNMWFLQHWLEWSMGSHHPGAEAYVRLPASKVWKGRY